MNRSWVEIDLDTVVQNLRIYQDSIPSHYKIMAVVKADAYGHGDVEVATVLSKYGITDFAVSNIEEACRLRTAGISGQILILGYTPPEEARRLIDNDITQTLISEDYAAELAKQGETVKCQFAIDTGMNRIGLDADDVDGCERTIRHYSNRFNLVGIFTHLCVADTDTDQAKSYTGEQIRKFEMIAERIADLHLPYHHCMNSAGGLWHKSTTSQFVRLGIILYGLKPDYANDLPAGIQPALSWKSVVSMVKAVHPGESIGYGRSFFTTKEMRVATIPTGYADGYNRHLSNKGFVLINGKKAPIVGRICMDQMMVDVTDIADAQMGTEVVLLGQSEDEVISADDMAHMIDTIGYEIVCNISSRVERRYRNGRRE